MRILIVDDQRSARRFLRQTLADLDDVEIAEAGNVDEALSAFEAAAPDMLLLDVRVSDDPREKSGLDVLRAVRAAGRSTPAVIVTSSTNLAEVRDAMRYGAQDYLLKDELCPEKLVPIVQGIRERSAAGGSLIHLRDRAPRPCGVATLTGSSPAMVKIRTLVSRVAESSCTVLLRGETGSGKEIVARALHDESSRRDQPFLAVNCSALPGALIESLVFGHERGAFTGADKRARGQLELARGGTVLLDEIAEMPAELQAKLLRVLEDRSFRPLGAESEVPLRARILASTHVDLERRIGEGRFREDLYFRLNVVTIDVPPLAERVPDIPALVAVFSAELSPRLRFTARAMDWLVARRWPGNVRELRNVVERVALLVEGDEVDVDALDGLARERSAGEASTEVERIARSLLALPARVGSKLDLLERTVLEQALAVCGGNKSAAARLIGISRKAIERRIARLAEGTSALPPEGEGDGEGEGE